MIKNTQNYDSVQRPSRKISFKIKTGSQKRNFNSNTLSATKVKELTNKYNQMVSKNEPEIKKIVKRVNSRIEKPKIRPKPKVELRKKPSVKRRSSIRTKLDQKTPEKRHSVQETIAIFEKKSIPISNILKTDQKMDKKTSDLYETLKITKTTSSQQVLKMAAETKMAALPNNSFLWRQKSKENVSLNIYSSIIYDDNDDGSNTQTKEHLYEDTGQINLTESLTENLTDDNNIYDVVEPKSIDDEIEKYEKLLQKTDMIINSHISSQNDDMCHQKTPENDDTTSIHLYESCYEKNYETLKINDNIYETLYPIVPLEPADLNLGVSNTTDPKNTEQNETENIYSTINEISTIEEIADKNKICESVTPRNGSTEGSNRDSLLSFDQTNSLYGKYSPSIVSSSSSIIEEWIDLSDQEFENSQFYVVRDKHKLQKKNSGWSNKVREQWKKNFEADAISDTYHYYESLNSDEFDSFDSDSDYELKTNQNDSGVEMGLAHLPDIPKPSVTNPQYGFTKLAQRLRKNWSLTKNDISKSLSRMTKKSPQKNLQLSTPMGRPRAVSSPVLQKIDTPSEAEIDPKMNISNSMSRKKNWLKFRRAQSMAENSEHQDGQILQAFNPNITKSTFYLTDDKPEVPVRKKMLRPQNPPPPIPTKSRNTSWYLDERVYTHTQNTKDSNTKTSWYTDNIPKDLTLEENKNKILQKPDLIPNSVFYTNTEQNTDDTDSYYNTKNEKFSTLLKDEPLYQFYDAEYTENCLSISSGSDSDYDGYETVGSTEIPQRNSLRNILKTGRTLWCEVPEVIRSQVLPSMNQTKKKLQEAKFEILTSETSYFNSLSILTNHFIPKICQDNFLTSQDQKVLFGNIDSVKKVSERLLNDLEISWNDSIFLTDVCSIIKKYSDNYFDCYVDYCANQGQSDNVLRKCKIETTPKNKSPQLSRFGHAIQELESNSNCQGLSLHSFLMLPMQRVTRLPLLVDAVLRRLSPDDDDYSSCLGALRSLQNLVAKCNEAARQTERLMELEKLKKLLDFPTGMKEVDLLENGTQRFLVKSGDLIQLLAKSSEEGLKLTFGKRFQKISLTLFVFEDWIVVAKKKSDDTFNVLHHCPRSFLEISPPESQQLTLNNSLLLFLTLLENQDGRQISMMLTCASETERERWVEALCPTKTDNPNEVIYESWDCPQVQAIHNYEAQQPDELNLKKGDIVNIDKKMADLWFHGEKLFDGQNGWFPGNFVTEIANPHVRARNLRQRYRLLALTNEYLNNSQNK